MAILFAYSRQHLQLCLQQARYLKFPSGDGLSMTTAPMEGIFKTLSYLPKIQVPRGLSKLDWDENFYPFLWGSNRDLLSGGDILEELKLPGDGNLQNNFG